MMRFGLIEYAVFIPVIYLGIVTSVEDIRFGKIYNRHIVTGLALGLIWYTLLALFYVFATGHIEFVTQGLPRVAGATLMALIISAGMWYFDVWSGADAKLYTVFAFLMPLSVYHSSDTPSAALTLLVNSYAAAFFWISADFLLRAARMAAARSAKFSTATAEERRADLRAIPLWLRASIFTWIKTFFGIVFILLLVRLLRGWLRDEIELMVHLNDTLLFLGLFLLFRPLHMLFQIRLVAAFILLALLGYFAWLYHSDPSGALLLEKADIGMYALGLIIFRQIYTFWSETVEVRRIPLTELRAKMIITEGLKRELVGREIFTAAEAKEINVEGLTDEFAVRLKEQYIDEKEPGTIEIENTIPFAPFIFAGMIISAIVGGVLVKLG